MILTVGVAVTLEAREGQFSEVWDARVLVAAHSILKARPGVVTVEFDPEDDRTPVFVVSIEAPYIAEMTSQLVVSENFSLVYAEDGGWKIQLLTLRFEVTPL